MPPKSKATLSNIKLRLEEVKALNLRKKEELEKELKEKEEKRVAKLKAKEQLKSDGKYLTKSQTKKQQLNQLKLSQMLNVSQTVEVEATSFTEPTTTEPVDSCVVAVVGHVDTGKTTLLDTLRGTRIQEHEFCGITQQISGFSHFNDKLNKNFLFIDTPGHEPFSVMRSRGISLCEVAILVVDILHGVEKQTIESLKLLKNTPFVVALNKIDRLYDKSELTTRIDHIKLQLSEQGINSLCTLDEVPKDYVNLVPISAKTGENLDLLLKSVFQIKTTTKTDCSLLDVKIINNFVYLEVLLCNSTIKENDSVIIQTCDGPKQTTIRSIYEPDKTHVHGAKSYTGMYCLRLLVKDATLAKRAIPGTSLFQTKETVVVPVLEQYNDKSCGVSTQVYLFAPTFGSLEAVATYFKSEIKDINIVSTQIGATFTKTDTAKMKTKKCPVVISFDLDINIEGIKCINEKTIYKLLDSYKRYLTELTTEAKEKHRNSAVFPCVLRTMPTCVFNVKPPILIPALI